MRETTVLGAAVAAGFAIGVWKEFSELKKINQNGRTWFKPAISKQESKKMYKMWAKAVEMCKGWVENEEKVDSEVESP